MVLDTSCRIALWNQALQEMTGWTAREMVGQNCSKLICASASDNSSTDDDVQPNACALLKVTDGKPAVISAQCHLLTRTGETIPVLKNARILLNDADEPQAAVVTFTDLRPMNSLQQALAKTRESLALVRPPGRLVGTSAPMADIYERIHLAAQSEATVLLLGETGTGKELVAEAIHFGSARAQGAFIKVNCSALTETLLEAELFGHVRGAFTGAVKDKIGRFEAADGGTLLLDEIGDLSPLIQLKLLRVLQEREFERVGESTPRRVDVRVICATHRDLRERVSQGLFRQDLFYRIRVFPLELPPLRQRKADIPALVKSFLTRFNVQTGKDIQGLSSEALHCLMDYCWPGNVRELENAIEHAFVVCQNQHIDLFDLPTEIRRVELREAYCPDPSRESKAEPVVSDTGESRESLLALLQKNNWNKSAVARGLGIDRTTIWRRMKRLGITPPANR